LSWASAASGQQMDAASKTAAAQPRRPVTWRHHSGRRGHPRAARPCFSLLRVVGTRPATRIRATRPIPSWERESRNRKADPEAKRNTRIPRGPALSGTVGHSPKSPTKASSAAYFVVIRSVPSQSDGGGVAAQRLHRSRRSLEGSSPGCSARRARSREIASDHFLSRYRVNALA
jgi:hypothetical protein